MNGPSNHLQLWRILVYFCLRVSRHQSLGFMIQQQGIHPSPPPPKMASTKEHGNNNDCGITNHLREIKGVIFDIDGTLADSWKLGYNATQAVLKNNNIPPITEELYHEGTRYSTPERLARHAGLLPVRDDVEFRRRGDSLAEEFDRLYVRLVSTETAAFYGGIRGLILDLPYRGGGDGGNSSGNIPTDNVGGGVKIAALTNACVAYAHAVLKVNCPVCARKASGAVRDDGNNDGDDCVYGRFQSIHGADTVPRPKPSPDGLYVCCKDIGIAAENCVYIGDSPSDAVAAKEAGMLAIGVLWGSHSEEAVTSAPFDFVCKSVDELKQLLPR